MNTKFPALLPLKFLDDISGVSRAAGMLQSLSSMEGIMLLLNLKEFKRLGKWVADFHSLVALVTAHRMGLFDILQEEKRVTREKLTKKLKVREKSLEVLLHALDVYFLFRDLLFQRLVSRVVLNHGIKFFRRNRQVFERDELLVQVV